MIRNVSPLVLLLGLVSCGLPFGSDAGDDTCPQTGEFSNYGCVRLVALTGDLPDGIATPYRWVVRAEREGVWEFAAGVHPLPEEVTLQPVLMVPPQGADTMTVTVLVQVRYDTGPSTVGPLPLVAVDSVRHTVRFAPMGERPDVDTVRFDIRRVNAP